MIRSRICTPLRFPRGSVVSAQRTAGVAGRERDAEPEQKGTQGHEKRAETGFASVEK